MKAKGLFDKTLIIVTSDHGDYLGDHWLGEKELFHEESVHIPLIIYNPDPAADLARGTVDDRLVESIDLAPTFVEAAGGRPAGHILEGRSLWSATFGEKQENWRNAVISECDYAFRRARVRPRRFAGSRARLYGPHRALEVHPLRWFCTAAFRSRTRSKGAHRSRRGSRLRRHSGSNARLADAMGPSQTNACDDRRRGDRKADGRSQDARLSIRGLVDVDERMGEVPEAIPPPRLAEPRSPALRTNKQPARRGLSDPLEDPFGQGSGMKLGRRARGGRWLYASLERTWR